MKVTDYELAKNLGVSRRVVKRWAWNKRIRPVSRRPRLYDLGQVKKTIREYVTA